jgi:hypothetical protein
MGEQTKKVYFFVDEAGQDAGSVVFVVVVVAVMGNLDAFRRELENIEILSGVKSAKWRKSPSQLNLFYLHKTMEINQAIYKIYFSKYFSKKYFFYPLAETIYKSISDLNFSDCQYVVCVDGMDKSKAADLTVILRKFGVKLKFIRGIRDESEPIIRLADRWAGCLRAFLNGEVEFSGVIKKAIDKGFLKEN